MADIATNPDTGERVILVGDKWLPLATNDKGQMAYLSDGAWVMHNEPSAKPNESVAKSPVVEDTSWGKVATDVASNFIPSLANMVKGVAGAIAHPIDTASGVVDIAAGGLQNALPKGVVEYINKTFPSASAEEARAKADAVGKFYVDRYGSMEGFKKALGQDPAGVMADATTVLSGGGALVSKVPGLASTGAALTKAGRAVDPLLQITRAAGKVIPAVGSGVASVLGGIGTHTGGESIRQIAQAGFEGGKKAQAAASQMRGTAPVSDLLDEARTAVDALRKQRSAEYVTAMSGVSGSTQVIPFNAIDQAVDKALQVKTFQPKNPNAKRVSTSPTTAAIQADIKKVVDDWKNLDPADYHTASGLDGLKQAIGDVRESLPFGTPSRKVADTVYNAVKNEIVKQDPSYAKAMQKYEDASDTLDEIKKHLTGGEKGSAITAMIKLQNLMSAGGKNKSMQMGLAKELEAAGAGTLLPGLAGLSMQDFVPRMLSGRLGAGIGTAMVAMNNPAVALGLMPLQSPRLVGEAALAAGRGAGLVDKGIRGGKGLLGGGINFPLDNYLYQANRLNTVSEEEQQ